MRPDPAIEQFVRRSGLISASAEAAWQPLSGGVSSDIWLVQSAETTFCVKRALPRLRVAAEWLAPVERNATEVDWLRAVSQFMPEAVPAVLAADSAIGVFAMPYFPPDSYEPWKSRLQIGIVSEDTASEVGRRLARLHSTFAQSDEAPITFATDERFHALRIEPYLLATARAHPDLAPILESLADETLTTRFTVVHGDVSPKNILLGPSGPVFIDAECAWFGDPSFDVAFCLNHLILKSFWIPSSRDALLMAFGALWSAYREGVDWESPDATEKRAARLLPALLLARIDGKSPVDYLDDRARLKVRAFARGLLTDRLERLNDLQDACASTK